MPADGVQLSPKNSLMNVDEIFSIAKIFVDHGVNKIRLTGGEPLVRKDFSEILKRLNSLNADLSLTTNGILVDRFIDDFKAYNLRSINVSLDTLQADKFKFITRRDQFLKAYENISLLVQNGFNIKLNVVLIKNFNDDEIFIPITKMRSIEFIT